MADLTWIYVIVADVSSLPVVSTKSGVPFKVGISRDPYKRLAQLQTGCPFRLFVCSIYWYLHLLHY